MPRSTTTHKQPAQRLAELDTELRAIAEQRQELRRQDAALAGRWANVYAEHLAVSHVISASEPPTVPAPAEQVSPPVMWSAPVGPTGFPRNQ